MIAGHPTSLSVATCRAVASGNAAHLAQLRRLRADFVALQDYSAQLERLLGLDMVAPPAVKIPPIPLKILGLLMSRSGWVSTSTIETALYGALPQADWPTSPRGAIKVHVKHLRNRLDVYGVTFEAIRSADVGGYFMPPDMKARARDLLAGKLQLSARGTADPKLAVAP